MQWSSLLTLTDDFDAFETQQIAQHLDLSFQFPDEFGVRILINNCLADDLLRTVRVPTSTNSSPVRTFKPNFMKNRQG